MSEARNPLRTKPCPYCYGSGMRTCDGVARCHDCGGTGEISTVSDGYLPITDIPNKAAASIGLKKTGNGWLGGLVDDAGNKYSPPRWLLDLLSTARAEGYAEAQCDNQLAALTQRAEQAERERDNWRSLYKELHCRLWCATPQEFEDEARTEGINHEDTLMECGRMISAQGKLTAAEAEVKQLREGIERAKNEVHAIRRIGISAGYMGFSGDWIASQCDSILKALLAQPSDGKEAGDDQPGPNSQPTQSR